MPGGRRRPSAATAVPATRGVAIARTTLVAGLPRLTVAALTTFGSSRGYLPRLARTTRILAVLKLTLGTRSAIGGPTTAAVTAGAGSTTTFAVGGIAALRVAHWRPSLLIVLVVCHSVSLCDTSHGSYADRPLRVEEPGGTGKVQNPGLS